MLKPHIHAKIIKAWADGATIEYLNRSTDQWLTIASPKWSLSTNYRVVHKPEFPKSTMTDSELMEAGLADSVALCWPKAAFRNVADAAVKKYLLSLVG
jgi:hypothetical protein